MESYYSAVYQEVLKRTVNSTVGTLGIRDNNLRDFVNKQLEEAKEKSNRIFADPVFEATFPWKEIDKTFNDLSDEGFLSQKLVEALDKEHKKVLSNGDEIDLSPQAMKSEWHPRTHQYDSWKVLKEEDPKSIVVTSGTGSGKTECFMVPILDDLVRQHEEHQQKLVGVQALFIYPLNALINSQRERVLSWSLNFKDNVRFCLYNGNTPNARSKADFLSQNPINEVYDRHYLRDSPPPILITNPTMLEYMMIRSADRPIINPPNANGRLKYIVLDEAHTYIGSQAAELALLIRRVLHGFGVKAKDVRFIATSATIGSDKDAQASLKKYLADIAGIDSDRIEVIDGYRDIPQLRFGSENNLNLEDLKSKDPKKDKDLFINNQTLKSLRSQFISQGNSKVIPNSLTDITKRLFPKEELTSSLKINALQWLDIISNGNLKQDNIHFLPLRAHFFHKVLHGLWACSNNNCNAKANTHLQNNWLFGKVYTQQRLKCDCGSPVFELVFCNECNEPHLVGEKKSSNGNHYIIQSKEKEVNEFELNQENPVDEEEREGNTETNKVVIHYNSIHDATKAYLNDLNEISDKQDSGFKIHYVGTGEICFKCDFKGWRNKEAFRHAYLGMPFYAARIIPALLEQVEDDKNNPLLKPFRGRRLLTFTDSRQGTAKIAMKIQQESERMLTRGLLFRVLANSFNPEAIKELENKIRDLENGPDLPTFRDILSEKKLELDAISNRTVDFNELINALQSNEDVKTHLMKVYRRYDGNFNNNPQLLARLIIIKEFKRRPKRANSLEAAGLVATEYRQISGLTDYPNELQAYDFSLNDWQDYLKILVDFYIRDGIFLNIEKSIINWLGGKFYPKLLLAPGSEDQDTSHRVWPQYHKNSGSRQNRMIRLLCHALKINLITITEKEIQLVNSVLEQSWVVLKNAGILKNTGSEGRSMDMESMSFKLLKKAWICPITNKFLDTTLKGITPYIPFNTESIEIECSQVNLPNYPNLNEDDSFSYQNEMRKWIGNSDEIKRLKSTGFWTEQNDRILEGGRLIRTEEHSAQQKIERLQEYEKLFKKGEINVLSCSTTMEMGVDIGGLSIVCNNNVPPHPSNYLQRAGRAGRRNESRSLSFTLCKNNPHDQQVFLNTMWPFEAKMKQPNITLSSDRIVIRHMNALIFAYFLNNELKHLEQSEITLKSGWFFEGENSIASHFINWMKSLITSIPENLKEGIQYLTKKSILEGSDLKPIILSSIKLMENTRVSWLSQLNYYENELKKEELDKSYKSKLMNDKEAHERVYLLSLMVGEGFLPGYGFPTNLATFDTYNYTQYTKFGEDREDDVSRLAGKPTRNTAVAINEYAPGNQIVLDGKVYTSRGISLNSELNNDQIKSKQAFKTAWRCRSCGTAGVSYSGTVGQCNACGKEINFEDNLQFLHPKGFKVSYKDEPTVDISGLTMVPSEMPWINTHVSPKHLINPNLGMSIADKSGEIFYHNKGQKGLGFAICLKCGYADSMQKSEDDPRLGILPSKFNDHNHLSKKRYGDENKCQPQKGAIKQNVNLGFVDKTDIFELYVKNTETNEFLFVKEDTNNKTLSYSLAVAFRHGLAKSLGVNAEELGFAIKQVHNASIADKPFYSICLYDTNSGGSGFATLGEQPKILQEMFKNAQELLNCPNCKSACQNCLLQFDTKEHADHLDRIEALNYLTDDIINALGLPEDQKIFGESSIYCENNFFDDIKMKSFTKADKITLFFGGNVEEWEIFNSSIRKHLSELIGPIGKAKELQLCISEEQLSNLIDRQKLDMFSLLSADNGISLAKVAHIPELDNGNVLSILNLGNKTITYASRSNQSLLFDHSWGDTGDEFLIKSTEYVPIFDLELINTEELIPKVHSGDLKFRVFEELNGLIDGFGERFWKVIFDKCEHNGIKLNGEETVVDLSYSDRYLKSPLTVLLFSQILESLPFNKSSNIPLSIKSMRQNNMPNEETHPNLNGPYRRKDYESNIKSNWFREEKEKQIEFISHFIPDVYDENIRFLAHKKYIQHDRELVINFQSNRSLIIQFDQGVGYWDTLQESPRFPFDDELTKQIEWAEQKVGELELSNLDDLGTPLTISYPVNKNDANR